MTGDSERPVKSLAVIRVRKDDGLPLQLSPSGLSTFRQCRQRYKFLYIDKLGDKYGRPRPYFTMANHVHATVKDFLSLIPAERRTEDAIEKILLRNWQRFRVGFRNHQDELRWQEKAVNQLKAFVMNHDVSVHPVMMEEFLRVQLTPGLVLCGRVDRVDREPDGSLHIIDYKTGNVPEETDWTQLELHALILSRRLPWLVSKVSYLYLSQCSIESSGVTKERLAQVNWDILGEARRIKRERKFLSSPGQWCSNCDFLPVCPKKSEVHRPAAARIQFELWDELDDVEGGQ